MKAVFAAAVILTLLAQQPRPTFRADTRLVELTVTALDKKGNPVTDLRAEDFTVQDNGKLRPITFFKYDGEPAAVTQPPLLSPDVFTNRVELSAGPPRNITAFVLDELNTPTLLNMRVRATAMRYLKALRPGNRMAVFYLGTRLRVLHDFTDDAASLRARIDKALLAVPLQNDTDISRSIIEAEQFVDMFEGDPVQQAIAAEMKRTQIEQDMQVNAQLRRSRLERTLASLEALGDHLAGIPGRKSLVWISGGISMLSVTGAMGMGTRGRQGYLSETDAARSARWSNEESTAVLTRAVGASAVQLTAACGPAPGEPGALLLKVRIEVNSLLFEMAGQKREAQLQLIFAEREPDGTTRKTTDSPTVTIGPEDWPAAQREGLLYTHRWKPARDALSVRIVVRDKATGQFGTLDVPLTKVAR